MSNNDGEWHIVCAQTSPVDEPEDDEQRLRGLPDEELKAEFETYRALVNPSTHGGYAPHGHTDALIDQSSGGHSFAQVVF